MFGDLKINKQDHHDAQQQIDVLKEKLLIGFENWYRDTFEHSGQVLQMEQQQQMMGTSQQQFMMEQTQQVNDNEDEQQVFKRAKKMVDTLHRARKMEK